MLGPDDALRRREAAITAFVSLIGAILGIFADFLGVAQTARPLLLGAAALGVLVAVGMWAGRRLEWIAPSNLLILCIAGFSVVVAVASGIGLYVDSRNDRHKAEEATQKAMAETCAATRDYIDAEIASVTSFAVSGRPNENMKSADSHTKETVIALTSAANRSGSAEARDIVGKFHREIMASWSYLGQNDGISVKHGIEAGRILRRLLPLCKASGNEVSVILDLPIKATVEKACASYYEFHKNAPMMVKQTDRQAELAYRALQLFTYHAELGADDAIREAERRLYRSFEAYETPEDAQEQVLAREDVTNICTARGYPAD
ncbi:hypothetical protein ACTI_67130 [Actinoplanes sp. OR16]|uniref:hypothetical protein n=1 Tax=Actinoplanes sp. OR16 TaxID=946334 RepID=UPI000F70364D|nr:hypothetical protein [Actinoplanes sp. OR16]BBH70028.1 hypothetical protein ACTI_67130 [Actinoplanes sp. OR16]